MLSGARLTCYDNASPGEQGPDTPAFVLIGGVPGLAGVIVARVQREEREVQDD